MNFNVIRLVKSNILNLFVCKLYAKFNINFAYPVNLYIEITNQCNSRCKMCDVWKRKKIIELPSSRWMEVIKEAKNINRNIKVNFAGGEALLKDDFFEILDFCAKEKIIFGLTTNGKLLTKENIKKFLDLKPFNLNISMDSLNNEIYRAIRGRDYLDEVKLNLDNLFEYKNKTGSKTIINLKTIVCSENLNEMEEIAIFARKKGFAGITFQPVVKTTSGACELFKINKSILKDKINSLIKLKDNGYSINNSKKNLLQWVKYFKNEQIKTLNSYCYVPIMNYYFSSNGDVKFCDYDAHILGNIQRDSFASIMRSKKNKKIQKQLVRCPKSCVYCVKRDLKDYFDLFCSYIIKT